jgi:hypothetical protein
VSLKVELMKWKLKFELEFLILMAMECLIDLLMHLVSLIENLKLIELKLKWRMKLVLLFSLKLMLMFG